MCCVPPRDVLGRVCGVYTWMNACMRLMEYNNALGTCVSLYACVCAHTCLQVPATPATDHDRVRRWKEWEDGAAGGYYINAQGKPVAMPTENASACICHCVLCAPKKQAPAVETVGGGGGDGGVAGGGAQDDKWMRDNSTVALVWERFKVRSVCVCVCVCVCVPGW
jgi:hypothetical protein